MNIRKIAAILLSACALFAGAQTFAAENEPITASVKASAKKTIAAFLKTCIAKSFSPGCFVPECRKGKGFLVVYDQWAGFDIDWKKFAIKKITFKKNQVLVWGVFILEDGDENADTHLFILCRRNGKWLIQGVREVEDEEDEDGKSFDFKTGVFK